VRIVGLEEHFVVPELLDAWSTSPGADRAPTAGFGDSPLARRLREVGPQRLRDMDDQG
jgi:hypothetical protein